MSFLFSAAYTVSGAYLFCRFLPARRFSHWVLQPFSSFIVFFYCFYFRPSAFYISLVTCSLPCYFAFRLGSVSSASIPAYQLFYSVLVVLIVILLLCSFFLPCRAVSFHVFCFCKGPGFISLSSDVRPSFLSSAFLRIAPFFPVSAFLLHLFLPCLPRTEFPSFPSSSRALHLRSMFLFLDGSDVRSFPFHVDLLSSLLLFYGSRPSSLYVQFRSCVSCTQVIPSVHFTYVSLALWSLHSLPFSGHVVVFMYVRSFPYTCRVHFLSSGVAS